MKMTQSIKITAMILSTIVILSMLGVVIYFVANPSQKVSVAGTSSVTVVPDVVAVYFNVISEGATASEVKDENAEVSGAVIAALVGIGVSEEDIVTEYYSIYQDYDWINGYQSYKGYIASHTLKVELTGEDMELAGEIIDVGVDAGANINYINFELKQETQNQYKTIALQQATQDARAKAEGIAQGLGKKLGRVVSVSTSEFIYTPRTLYASEDSAGTDVEEAKQAVTNIQPGEQEISGYVEVIYSLR